MERLTVVMLMLLLIAPPGVFAASESWHRHIKAALAASQSGNYEQAESLLSFAMKEADKSNNKIWTVITLNQLGLLYQDQDEYEKAELLFNQALAMSQKAFGPSHPEVADCLAHCAAISRMKGQNDKADAFDRQATACLHHSAAIERRKGHKQQALKLEQCAEEIRNHQVLLEKISK